MDLFVYGTLISKNLASRVLGKSEEWINEHYVDDVTMLNFSREPVGAGRLFSCYPSPGTEVQGKMIVDLSDDDTMRLDMYEGYVPKYHDRANYWQRNRVTVRLADGSEREVSCYTAGPSAIAERDGKKETD